MTGIVGILGEASESELYAMARRMAYRGRYVCAWSPAPGVLLGELHSSLPRVWNPGELALDRSDSLYPRDPSARADDETLSEHQRAQLSSELRVRGSQALLSLRGHFALAWWNSTRRTLVLATDRHCYKTIYYVRLPGRVAFATDCKALLALADCPAVVDRKVLQTYLRTLEVPFDKSLLQGVHALAGAQFVEISPSGLQTRLGADAQASELGQARRYWNKQRHETSQSFAEAKDALRATLESVISRALRGHRRIGLTLSGGLDSAVLLALTRRVRPDIEIATYTVGYGPDDPEILGARETAGHFSTEHHEHLFSLHELSGVLPRFVWLTEDLMGREETVLQQVITGVAAARERVIMAGNGADLAFGGMPRHRLLWLRDRAPPPLRGALDELFLYTQIKKAPRSWLGRLLLRRAFADIPEPPSVLGAGAERFELDYSSMTAYQRESIADKPFCYHEPIDTHLGITMLAPFSTPEIMELALGCPDHFLVGPRRQKLLLRAAVADLLPARVSERAKAIQRLRHDSTLSDVLDSIAKSLDLDSAFAQRGLLPHGYVEKLRSRGPQGAYSSTRLHSIWGLICAELWQRQFIDARGAPIAGFDSEIIRVPTRDTDVAQALLDTASARQASLA